MKLTQAQRAAATKILTHEREDFAEIARAAAFDPWTSFQDSEFRGVDFGTSDLTGSISRAPIYRTRIFRGQPGCGARGSGTR